MTASILFARIELGFSFIELVFLLLEFEVACAVGGILHLWAQKKIGWDSRKMMLYHLTFYSILTVYVLLGVIPGITFGLVNKWEIWMITVLYGMNAASLVGFGRSMTGNLIPDGKENELFSLYAITDKGSSWIGPAIMGVFSNLVGIRWPLLYVLIFFVVSIPIIYGIDMEEGLQQAGRVEAHSHDDAQTKDEDEQMKKEKEGGVKDAMAVQLTTNSSQTAPALIVVKSNDEDMDDDVETEQLQP